MHFILACSVQVGDLNASPFIHSVEVKSGWRDLTDEAKITIPKALVSLGLAEVNPGDPVSITLGYEGYQKEVFTGFVKQVNPKTPLEIECEDASYLLKRTNIQKFWKEKVTLQEIVDHLVSETNAANPDFGITLSEDIPEITFTKFRIANANAAQVLEKFKQGYGLTAYFRGSELHVGLAYRELDLGEVTYDLNNNVIDHNKLEYRRLDQNKLLIKAKSLQKDNTFLEVEVGDEGGHQIPQFYRHVSSKDELKQLAQEDLKKLKYEGYRGSLRTFMVPFARHGMTARIIDTDLGRDSRHIIDSTVLRFEDGITIDVGIGIKLG